MRVVMSVGLLLLLACPAATPEVAEQTPAPTPKPAVPPGTDAAMVDHFHESLRIKHAVIAGELADVPPAAQRLAEQLVHDRFPEPWRPYLHTTERMAAAAGAAREMPEAAAAAAGLAAACGECHSAIGGGPKFPAPGVAPTPAPHDTASQMARHQWAADRMWEALVSRSDRAWTAGAAALVDAPLSTEDITKNVELPEDVLRLGARVQELARRGETVSDWPERTAIYGEFLASCAGCHKGGC